MAKPIHKRKNSTTNLWVGGEIEQLPAFTLDSSLCLTTLHKRDKGEPARPLQRTELSVPDIKAQMLKSDYRQF
jgi:hypothetical protein